MASAGLPLLDSTAECDKCPLANYGCRPRCGSIPRPARGRRHSSPKATQAIPVVSVLVRANVRGTGDHREPNEKLDAVVLFAAAWLVSSPTQLPHDLGAGVFTHSVRGAFQGLTELTALNR